MSHFSKSLKRIQKITNATGDTVVIRWTLPAAGAEADPTSGAVSIPGTEMSCTTKAFVHHVGASRTGYRAMQEVQEGDIMLDFAIPLYRVTNAGGSTLTVGDVVDKVALSRAKRAMSPVAIAIQTEDVLISDLFGVSFETHGEVWAPLRLGTNAPKSVTMLNGTVVSQTVYARRIQ